MDQEQLLSLFGFFLSTLLLLFAFYTYVSSYGFLDPLKLIIDSIMLFLILLLILFCFSTDTERTELFTFLGFPTLLLYFLKLIVIVVSPGNKLLLNIYMLISLVVGLLALTKNIENTRLTFKKLKDRYANK